MILIILSHNYIAQPEIPIQPQECVTVYEQEFCFAAAARIPLLGQSQSLVALGEEEDLPPASQSSGTC